MVNYRLEFFSEITPPLHPNRFLASELWRTGRGIPYIMHTLINLNVKNRVNDLVIILQLAQKHIKDGIIQKD